MQCSHKSMMYCANLILVIFIVKIKAYELRPTVNTVQGTIIGVKVYPDASKVVVNAYLGIPYAKSPDGQLRFAVPQKHSGSNETLYANQLKAICPFRVTTDINTDESEDCLYLNIWIPEDIGFNTKLLPVIVYFETELVINNRLVRVPGHDLAAEGIAVVSVSYRRNIFGFFCLGSADARGNLGLLDQYMALVWIKENILKFGGNPQSITIVGYYSSAMTIMYQMISPKTHGLFHKAIIMSGSAIIQDQSIDAISISKELTVALGCPMISIRESIKCLRKKSTQEIMQHFERQVEHKIQDKSILPISDTFLYKNDQYLPFPLKGEYLRDIPVLTGIVDSLLDLESSTWSQININNFAQVIQYTEESILPALIQRYGFDGPKSDLIKDVIRWKYLWSNHGDVHALLNSVKSMEWDAKIAAPFHQQLIYLTNVSRTPVYAYCLHQPQTFSNNSQYSAISSDLLFLFGPVLLQQIARRRFYVFELRLSNYFKLIWTTFAQYGNPVNNTGYDRVWQPYNKINPYIHYIGFDSESKQRIQDFYSNMNLWNQLLPILAANTTHPMNDVLNQLQCQTSEDTGFRHATYTMIGLVIALLVLLLVCIVLLKRRIKENTRHIYM